jgi:hypothetical protein
MFAATQHNPIAHPAKSRRGATKKTLLIDRPNPFRLHALCPMLAGPPQGAGESVSIDTSVILEESDFEIKCQWEAREF